jgi:hypothetical protein
VPKSKADKQQCLLKMIQAINSKLEPLNLSGWKGMDEDDGSNYFMLVNTSSRVVAGSRDLAWKVQRQFSEPELEFFRILAREILDLHFFFFDIKYGFLIFRRFHIIIYMLCKPAVDRHNSESLAGSRLLFCFLFITDVR